MENWEFLLQKEGDRSWLPLESPDVEVLEGRYRVVARSRLSNVSVELRITYLATDEDPPKRRVQKRLATTNDEGLIAILPWTHFKPGIWELCCQSVEREATKSWQQQVTLEVLPTESGDLVATSASPDESETVSWQDLSVSQAVAQMEQDAAEALPSVANRPDFSTLTPLGSVVPEELEGLDGGTLPAPTATPSPLAVDAPLQVSDVGEQERAPATSGQEVPENPDLDSPNLTETPISPPSASIPPFTPETEPKLPTGTPISKPVQEVPEDLQIILDQTNWVVKQGEAFVISGKVDRGSSVSSEGAGNASEPTPIPTGELQICLRDPQNSQVLVDTRQPIAAEVPPFVFACALYIPLECQTQVILGEVVLWCQQVPLSQVSFTITMPLEYLLGAIQQNFNPDSHQAKIPTRKDHESFGPPLWKPPVDATPLPPQLYNTIGREKVPEKLEEPMPELPSFGNFLNTSTPLHSRPELYSIKSFIDLVKAKSEQGKISAESPTEPTMVSPAPSPEAVISETSAAPALDLTPETSEKDSFESLNLPDRFWSRLSSMAQDDELQDYLKVAMPELAELEAADPALGGNVVHEVLGISSPPEETWEIVVDYEPLDPPKLSQSRTATPPQTAEDHSTASPLVLPEDQPVPTPTLELLTPQVVAGRPLKVRVRFPEIRSRIYVKVWVYDRQSQTIVDGPRWLTEFMPTGFGVVEAMTTLEVAYGCLEVELAAIAVEMATQRESHKVALEVLVVPPSQPQLPLEIQEN